MVTTIARAITMADLTPYERAMVAFRSAMLTFDAAPRGTAVDDERVLAERFWEAERQWLHTPSPDAGAVLDKLRHLWREDQEPNEDEKAAIIADLYRLSQRRA